MKQVNLYEAKTHLSSLVDEAAAGEEIVIAKNGKPLAKLLAFEDERARSDTRAKKEPRKLGQWATPGTKNINWDEWWRDWKAMDKEIEADFEASIAKPFPGEPGGAKLKHRRGLAEDATPVTLKKPKSGRFAKRKGSRR
ncbi:MAG: type II toxin-antitoxin system prevent-host-death family antitoxin [Alphaproteobacteria bacterium]|nr:type II toxin-antitoxin system prevent-host-death family antitoxin [Alphaproteobacteria bacterium]